MADTVFSSLVAIVVLLVVLLANYVCPALAGCTWLVFWHLSVDAAVGGDQVDANYLGTCSYPAYFKHSLCLMAKGWLLVSEAAATVTVMLTSC